ncbi:hypothetical protein ANCCAN_10308 [Ancylostoma caninum]|uniref:Ig-like domain-containing protein n=1 Tax=Ancylostoma caninum TaxID=29170 RepID=A0A368GH91_ANCCA|nr:hypothetical protein ANCCAN_10308 [Ancylostoma caninum]
MAELGVQWEYFSQKKHGEYVHIQLPPAVSRGTPSAVEVREGHNVTLTCKAEGNPTPSVVWRRQDKQIIRYNGATGFGGELKTGAPGHVTRKIMSYVLDLELAGYVPEY